MPGLCLALKNMINKMRNLTGVKPVSFKLDEKVKNKLSRKQQLFQKKQEIKWLRSQQGTQNPNVVVQTSVEQENTFMVPQTMANPPHNQYFDSTNANDEQGELIVLDERLVHYLNMGRLINNRSQSHIDIMNSNHMYIRNWIANNAFQQNLMTGAYAVNYIGYLNWYQQTADEDQSLMRRWVTERYRDSIFLVLIQITDLCYRLWVVIDYLDPRTQLGEEITADLLTPFSLTFSLYTNSSGSMYYRMTDINLQQEDQQ